MTNKRFTLIDDPFEPLFKDNGKTISEREVVKLLNQLHQENQEWKEKLSNAIDIARLNQNAVMEFLAENRKLKEENKKLRNIHLSIDLTYSYGYGGYLADVRVIDDE